LDIFTSSSLESERHADEHLDPPQQVVRRAYPLARNHAESFRRYSGVIAARLSAFPVSVSKMLINAHAAPWPAHSGE
jgi:hypothetical protein